MILILTSRDDATVDYVVARLKRSEYLRIDSDALPDAVKIDATEYESTISVGRKRFAPSDFSGVWYRRPKVITFTGGKDPAECRHAAAEYTAALEGFLALIPENKWVNLPARNVQAGHKLEQVRRAQALGLRVPQTQITQEPRCLRQFWRRCQGQVIVKPMSSGYIEREAPAVDSLIYTNALQPMDLKRIAEIKRCPSLFQERIAKVADIRVTIIDQDIQAVELTASDAGKQRLDIRRNNMNGVKYRAIDLPRPIVMKIHRLLRSYTLRFAAVDLLQHADSGYVFLEINPNGQWAWLDMAGATNTRDCLIQALRAR